MNKCSVCDKDIPIEATECSYNCVIEASRKFKATKQHSATFAFQQAMRKMLDPKPVELRVQGPEVMMITIKHRWKKNRSEQIGDLVLMFDENGFAQVQDIGNNRRTVDLAIKFGKGLLEVIEDKSILVVDEGAHPKGMLNFKGDNWTPDQLEAFKRQWVGQVAGTENFDPEPEVLKPVPVEKPIVMLDDDIITSAVSGSDMDEESVKPKESFKPKKVPTKKKTSTKTSVKKSSK